MRRFFLLMAIFGLSACAASPLSHLGSGSGDRTVRVYRCDRDQLACNPVYSALLERTEGCYDFYIEGQWAGAWLAVTGKEDVLWLPAVGRPALISTEPVSSYATKLEYCNTVREPGKHLLTLAACNAVQCDPAGPYAQFTVVIR